MAQTSSPLALPRNTWGAVALVLIPVLLLIGLAASAASSLHG